MCHYSKVSSVINIENFLKPFCFTISRRKKLLSTSKCMDGFSDSDSSDDSECYDYVSCGPSGEDSGRLGGAILDQFS